MLQRSQRRKRESLTGHVHWKYSDDVWTYGSLDTFTYIRTDIPTNRYIDSQTWSAHFSAHLLWWSNKRKNVRSNCIHVTARTQERSIHNKSLSKAIFNELFGFGVWMNENETTIVECKLMYCHWQATSICFAVTTCGGNYCSTLSAKAASQMSRISWSREIVSNRGSNRQAKANRAGSRCHTLPKNSNIATRDNSFGMPERVTTVVLAMAAMNIVLVRVTMTMTTHDLAHNSPSLTYS